ncbi:hypothetical protein PFMALIP_01593 [Plasmodium falciparum MaliPS096_E11]|nr:hypothetical protein PFMALIP_01593 [Plasmodium falciparum MaliPS096_E11]
MNENNDLYMKKINEKYFPNYHPKKRKKKKLDNTSYINHNYNYNYPYNYNLLSNNSKSRILKVGCHNILNIGDILKYDGDKIIYPCGYLNMRIFYNLPSYYLFQIYKNANIDDINRKTKLLEKIFLQLRATYIFSITLREQNFFFSILLFPLINIDYFSESDATNFILAEGYNINEVYMKFLSLFNSQNYICDDMNNDYSHYNAKYGNIYKCLETYILKSVEHNKFIDSHTFFGLTLPCVVYQIKYKLFKYMYKHLSEKIKTYIKKSKDSVMKKRIKGCTREVVYNDNVLCKYSNLDTTIFKENEKENEKNIRKTVKYKYNINSAMSYRYLMNISSNLRLYVKKSSIHGYGLYTCEFINEGEVKIIFICYIWLERKYILSY